MNKIVQILCERDSMRLDDASELMDEMFARVEEGEDPEEVLLDEAGLEPDYVFDLLDWGATKCQ